LEGKKGCLFHCQHPSVEEIKGWKEKSLLDKKISPYESSDEGHSYPPTK